MAKLHLINVADTNDADIGTGCAANAGKVKSLFSEIRAITGLAGRDLDISRPELSAADIDRTIDGLEVEPDADVVVFYYSGHGHMLKDGLKNVSEFPGFDYPKAAPSGKPATLDGVAARVQNKRPKLALCIADCCDNVTYSPPIRREAGPPVLEHDDPDAEDRRKSKIRAMFINSTGALVMASASLHQEAMYYNDGGVFTKRLITIFNSPPEPDPAKGDLWHAAVARLKQTIPTTDNEQTAVCNDNIPCQIGSPADKPMALSMVSLPDAPDMVAMDAAAPAAPSLLSRLFHGWLSGAKG